MHIQCRLTRSEIAHHMHTNICGSLNYETCSNLSSVCLIIDSLCLHCLVCCNLLGCQDVIAQNLSFLAAIQLASSDCALILSLLAVIGHCALYLACVWIQQVGWVNLILLEQGALFY